MYSRFKIRFYKSFVYNIYLYVISLPFYRFFADYSYFKKKILSIPLFKNFFKHYERFIYNINKKNIADVTGLKLIITFWIFVLCPQYYSFILNILSLYFSILFILDKRYTKDTFIYVTFSILYVFSVLILKIVFRSIELYGLLKAWSCVTVFIIAGVYLKMRSDTNFLKNISFAQIILIINNIIFKSDNLYKIIILTPFLYLFIFKKFYGILKNVLLILSVEILLLLASTKGGTEFSVIVLETVILFSLSGIKYILFLFIVMPSVMINITNKVLKDWNFAGHNVSLKGTLFIINNGIKGVVQNYRNILINKIDKEIIENFTYSEKTISVLFIIVFFIFIFFLGKYLFKLVRKIVLAIIKKRLEKAFSISVISFFVGTILFMLISDTGMPKLAESHLYWFILGFIRAAYTRKH